MTAHAHRLHLRLGAWQLAFALVDRLSRRRNNTSPQHLRTGQQGEEAALFYLRRLGFTVIAHNWRSGRAPGDLDLVAWEQNTLCFLEVKTRSTRAVATAESAIDQSKRRSLRRLAHHYLRQLPPQTVSRFDVVSVYHSPGKSPDISLYRNAFAWDEHTVRLPL